MGGLIVKKSKIKYLDPLKYDNIERVYKDIKSIASSHVQPSSCKEKNKTVPEIINTQQNDQIKPWQKTLR